MGICGICLSVNTSTTASEAPVAPSKPVLRFSTEHLKTIHGNLKVGGIILRFSENQLSFKFGENIMELLELF